MKKPTDHYGPSASAEAVQARLAELQLPDYISAGVLLVFNCATQLQVLANSDTPEQRKTTLAACKLARESIVEMERMLK